MNNILTKMKGKKCWSIIAGSGTGSVVGVGFGTSSPRKKALCNSTLSEDIKNLEPELEIMIHCAWRLSQSRKVICGWRDSNEFDGPMIRGLNSLKDKKLIEFSINKFTYDLWLLFEDDLNLNIFCDQTNDYDSDENYSLFTSEKIYTVGLNCEFDVELRQK